VNARAKEYKKRFWEKQLDFFAEACEATGTVTYAAEDSPDFKQDSSKFEELFWGRLAIVESDAVADQMVEIRKALATPVINRDRVFIWTNAPGAVVQFCCWP
jgi:hypothetical protein